MKKHKNKSPDVRLRGMLRGAGKQLFLLLAIVTAITYSLPISAQNVNVDNSKINIGIGAFVTTDGNVTIQNSGAIDNSGTVKMKGDWTDNASGLINASPGTVELNGSTNQNVGGSSVTSFNNLTMSNVGGATITGNETVNGTLQFNNGLITTNANTLELGNSATVSGAAGGKYVYGNLKVDINATGSKLFAIGDAFTYAPVNLNMNSLGASGNVTAFTTPGAEPNENTPVTNASGINPAAKANRYWTMANSGITTPNYDATFNFSVAEASGNPLNYVVRKFNSPSTWSATTLGAVTTTSTQATGLTSFSEFEVGAVNTLTVATQPSPASACAGFNAVFTSSSTSVPATTVQWEENQGAGFNPLSNTPPYSGVNTGTLTITGATTGMNNWQYRAVFTNINGTATSNPATLTVNALPVVSAGFYPAHCSSDPAFPLNNGTPSGGNYSGTGVSANTFNPAAGTQTVTYTYTDGNTCTNTAQTTININPGVPTGSVSSVTGATEACTNDIKLMTANNNVAGGVINFSWTVASGSSPVQFSSNIGGPFSNGPYVTSGNTVYAKFISLNSGSSGYNVCVKGVNGCGSGTSNRCGFIRGATSTPGFITGPTAVCPSQAGVGYTAGTVTGGGVYTWSFPGATFTAQGSAITGVNFPANTNGQLCVTSAVTCTGGGTGVQSPPICKTLSNNVSTPAVIDGPAAVCPGTATVYTYSVLNDPSAASYQWTLPAGVVGSSSSNIITVVVNSLTGSPNICVKANSPCTPLQSASRCKGIASGIAATPSNIGGAPLKGVCSGNPLVYSVVNVPGTTYNWTYPVAQATNVSANGTNQFGFTVTGTPTLGNFNLSVTATSATCPSSPSVARSVVISGPPDQVPSINQSNPVCAAPTLVTFTASVPPGGAGPNYNWSVTGGAILSNGGVPPYTNSINVNWGGTNGTVSASAKNACGVGSTKILNVVITCREEGFSLSETNFSAYPNPAHDKLTLSIDAKQGGVYTIQLSDLAGRTVQSDAVPAAGGKNTYEMNLSSLAKGVYMLTVQSASDSWKTKVIVE
jgi:hypothetical protein